MQMSHPPQYDAYCVQYDCIVHQALHGAVACVAAGMETTSATSMDVGFAWAVERTKWRTRRRDHTRHRTSTFMFDRNEMQLRA